jgi:hypothetical protein
MTLSETEQRLIYTDGRGIMITSNSSTSNPARPYIAEWETNNQLVIEIATKIGQIEEHFSLSKDGKQLHTKTILALPNLDDSVTVTRIYDLIVEE